MENPISSAECLNVTTARVSLQNLGKLKMVEFYLSTYDWYYTYYSIRKYSKF